MAHPLLQSMYEMYKESRVGLESVFNKTPFKHVATYVVVLSKAALLCNVLPKTKKKKPEERAAFGGGGVQLREQPPPNDQLPEAGADGRGVVAHTGGR
jgi:hypothetical protein